jgi:hypothetical protein
MRPPMRYGFLVSGLFVLVPAFLTPTQAAEGPVLAVVESSLKSDPRAIRQYAFDGDNATYFASAGNATKADHFTLTFDEPVVVKSIDVLTGTPRGAGRLERGVLQVSGDGLTFEDAARFTSGRANVKFDGKKIQAVRVKPTEDMKQPLAIREFVVDSEPKVVKFKYPVEIIVDVRDDPTMKEWAEKAARICEKNYAMICEELRSPGFRPPTVVSMSLTNSYNGVAMAGNGQITGSVKFFKEHPDDFGAMVHETVHIVQSYGRFGGNNPPGWLVEGIADYVRFYKYEPGKLARIPPDLARYDASYQITARFLAYVTEKYDKELVRKLNAASRDGKYRDAIWKELTGKTVEELGLEWKRSLAE